MCDGSRTLNQMTIKDEYPMPQAVNLFDESLHARVVTELDLGHIITDHGVKMDQKVDAVNVWPVSRTKPELCSYLDWAGYYRKFIRRYAQRVHPMHVRAS
ncbi:hypothetical protein WJX73_005500 [Symbiochloris irregularis]|uniref:Uncharacterized protein n=1 Tax=Symbiochloris irregularis TaxID=706552 RepID=A0AAW1P472_9CHLO